MELKDFITVRKSTRSYKDTLVDNETIAKIEEFISTIKPLYPEIKTKAQLVNRKEVKTIMPWFPPQAFALYSEEKDGMYENIGFMFQQLDLYFHSLGLGSCWIGLGKANDGILNKEEVGNFKFVILLAFGYPKNVKFRNCAEDFKRKSLGDISNCADTRLGPARLAPSAVNGQPWYFVTDGDVIHTYCVKKGIFMPKMLKSMNLIDTGIALAHMYVLNDDSFEFFKSKTYPEQKGYGYVGSFRISPLS